MAWVVKEVERKEAAKSPAMRKADPAIVWPSK